MTFIISGCKSKILGNRERPHHQNLGIRVISLLLKRHLIMCVRVSCINRNHLPTRRFLFVSNSRNHEPSRFIELVSCGVSLSVLALVKVTVPLPCHSPYSVGRRVSDRTSVDSLRDPTYDDHVVLRTTYVGFLVRGCPFSQARNPPVSPLPSASTTPTFTHTPAVGDR